MLIVASALGVAVDVAVAVFCVLAGIGALDIARMLSPREQRRAIEGDDGAGRLGRTTDGGDVGSPSSVWLVVAFRVLYIVLGIAFLAPLVLAIAGVIPWN